MAVDKTFIRLQFVALYSINKQNEVPHGRIHGMELKRNRDEEVCFFSIEKKRWALLLVQQKSKSFHSGRITIET